MEQLQFVTDVDSKFNHLENEYLQCHLTKHQFMVKVSELLKSQLSDKLIGPKVYLEYTNKMFSIISIFNNTSGAAKVSMI